MRERERDSCLGTVPDASVPQTEAGHFTDKKECWNRRTIREIFIVCVLFNGAVCISDCIASGEWII
jgi:hypothetical protein